MDTTTTAATTTATSVTSSIQTAVDGGGGFVEIWAVIEPVILALAFAAIVAIAISLLLVFLTKKYEDNESAAITTISTLTFYVLFFQTDLIDLVTALLAGLFLVIGILLSILCKRLIYG